MALSPQPLSWWWQLPEGEQGSKCECCVSTHEPLLYWLGRATVADAQRCGLRGACCPAVGTDQTFLLRYAS